MSINKKDKRCSIRLTNNPRIQIASVYAALTNKSYELRKQSRGKQFVDRILRTVDTRKLTEPPRLGKLSATIRNAIKNGTVECTKNPHVNFSSLEINILLQMFYHLTQLEKRDMTEKEFKTFLYFTLGFTNEYAIDGIYRAARRISHRSRTRALLPGLTAGEFVLVLSFILRGNIYSRAELAFYVMDIDNDGLIRRAVEFNALLKGSFDLSVAVEDTELESAESLRETMNYLSKAMLENHEQGINLPQFILLMVDRPWLIESLVPCLLSELTNIAFQSLLTTHIYVPSIENPEMRKHYRSAYTSWQN